MRSMCTSTANSVCGAPNPRKAPLGGVLRATSRGRRCGCCRSGTAPRRECSRARAPRRAQRDVRAAVEQHVDVHRDELAVAREAGAMPHDRRMTLGRRHHVFHAVVDDLHRAARLDARAAPRVRRSSTDTLPCRRTLRRSRSESRAPWHRRPKQTAKRLDRRRTDTAPSRTSRCRRLRARRSHRSARCRRAPDVRCDTSPSTITSARASALRDVALHDVDVLERQRRFLRIEQRLRFVVLDLDLRREQRFPGSRGRAGGSAPPCAAPRARRGMADPASIRSTTLLPGDVAVIHDREARRVEVEMDAAHGRAESSSESFGRAACRETRCRPRTARDRWPCRCRPCARRSYRQRACV